MSWVMRVADPPLDPTADQARSLLRRELLEPEYHDQAPVARFVDWLREQLARGVDAAAGSAPLTTLAAMVLLVLLVVGLAWALSRARRGARSAAVDGAVLGEDGLSAVELRARAEGALAEGDHATALLDAFRALALRQVERGRIEGLPGATAHELSGALGDAFPPLRDRLVAAAGSFDRVLYGERPATAGQARAVLTLDDELVGVR
ncbi:MAG: DUF4129 domain-containing protein [Nocardioides sp.]